MTKRKNNKKKNLKSLILILFLTIVMLSTATFAWFTSNQLVTISKIDVNVATSTGLQISTNASDWKTVISTDDITSADKYKTNITNVIPNQLNAVSTSGTVSAGLLNMYKGAVTSNAQGVYEITSTESLVNSNDYVVFDVYLRTDRNETIYLNNTSNVTSETGKGLENATRVAFVVEGNATTESVAADPSTIRSAATGTSAVIWEPNSETHSARGTANALDFGITVNGSTHANGSKYTPYYGLKNTFSKQTLMNIMKGTDTSNTAAVTSIPTASTYSTATNLQQMFTVSAGVTKVRIYMWIEGQDVDCENNASGSKASYVLALTTESTAATS